MPTVKPRNARVTIPPTRRKDGEIMTDSGKILPFRYWDSVMINVDSSQRLSLSLQPRKKRISFQRDQRVVWNFRSQFGTKGKGVVLAPYKLWVSLKGNRPAK